MYDNAMNNVTPAQSILKEPRPVEVSPGPELEIDEHAQHGEDNRKHCVLFFGHAMRNAQYGAVVVSKPAE